MCLKQFVCGTLLYEWETGTVETFKNHFIFYIARCYEIKTVRVFHFLIGRRNVRNKSGKENKWEM